MKYIALSFFLFNVLFAAAQQQKTEHLTVDSISRRFEIYIPSASNTDKLPVLISLHGRLGTGRGMMGFAEFRSIAYREKFIIVCPDGVSKSWNDGRPTRAQKKGINDVKFIDKLITYTLKTYNGDSSRVYVTGMSNGGFMASRVACELSNRIAAIAVVGASMDKNVSYHQNKAVPVMYIQGTKDPLVPYEGGAVKSSSGGDVYGHSEVLKLWAGVDHCDNSPVITNVPDNKGDGTSIIKEEYTNPSNSVKVVGYTITNGGHTWPGGTQYLPKFLIGPVSHNLNACEVIWDFFKGYRLVN